ncbi:MAG: response regulator [Bacteroidota bacterium]
MNFILIEDNYDHAEMFRRQVRRLCPVTNIHHFTDGVEALEFAILPDTKFDLVVVDLQLRIQNGMDIVRKFLEAPRIKQFPIVVLTSSATERETETSLPIQEYLLKPIDEDMVSFLMNKYGRAPQTSINP